MAMPDRPGRYRATVIDRGVSETGPNNLCTFIPRFALTEELVNGEWQDIRQQGLEITAYVYIERKDKSLNDVGIKQLKDAFLWDGRDPFWLEETPELPACQLTLDYESYQGVERMKVKWIDHHDSDGGGGVQKSDDDLRKRVRSRLGSKLRAQAGGSPAAKPAATPPRTAPAATPTAPPAAPPRKAAPVVTPATPTPAPDADPMAGAITSSAECWTAFCAVPEVAKMTEESLANYWFECVKAVLGHDNIERATNQQFAEIITQAEMPF